MDEDFVPFEIIKRMMHWWWMLVVIMIIGGVFGMLFTRIHPPIYESNAAITTAIDYAYAGRITDEDEDYLISTVGDFISSSPVIDNVIKNAKSAGIELTQTEIDNNFSKSRQGYRWVLSVRDTDASRAQLLNQLWVEASAAELETLRERSVDSLLYQSAQLALETCVSQSVSINPVSASCDLEKIAEMKDVFTEGSDTGYSISEAILLTKITTQVTQDASIPTVPVLFKQNLNTLMGALIGLIFGIGALLFWQPKKK